MLNIIPGMMALIPVVAQEDAVAAVKYVVKKPATDTLTDPSVLNPTSF